MEQENCSRSIWSRRSRFRELLARLGRREYDTVREASQKCDFCAKIDAKLALITRGRSHFLAPYVTPSVMNVNFVRTFFGRHS